MRSRNRQEANLGKSSKVNDQKWWDFYALGIRILDSLTRQDRGRASRARIVAVDVSTEKGRGRCLETVTKHASLERQKPLEDDKGTHRFANE